MKLIIVLLLAAVIPTFVELRRDGMHRLDWRDDRRGLRSHLPAWPKTKENVAACVSTSPKVRRIRC